MREYRGRGPKPGCAYPTERRKPAADHKWNGSNYFTRKNLTRIDLIARAARNRRAREIQTDPVAYGQEMAKVYL